MELTRQMYETIKRMNHEGLEFALTGIEAYGYEKGHKKGFAEGKKYNYDTKNTVSENDLLELRSIHEEIQETEEKMKKIMNQREELCRDKVQGSGREWPYIGKSITIEGISEETLEKRKKDLEVQIKILNELLQRSSKKETEVMRFISEIGSSETRRMAQLRYFEGKTWEQIGEIMRCDRTTVQKKLKKELISWQKREKI